MEYQQALDAILRANEGRIDITHLKAADIPTQLLRPYAEQRGLVQIAFKTYVSTTSKKHILWHIQQTYPESIYSHETALYLHGMIPHEPPHINFTFCDFLSLPHLRKRNIIACRNNPEYHSIGETNMTIKRGQTIRVYDLERTVLDIIKARDQYEKGFDREILLDYLRRDDRKILRLQQYAREIRAIEPLTYLVRKNVCHKQWQRWINLERVEPVRRRKKENQEQEKGLPVGNP